jgi:hypothetical protein
MTGRAGTMATPARSGRALAAVAGQLERGVRRVGGSHESMHAVF